MKNVKHILILTPGFPADENDSTCIPPLQDFLLHFKSRFIDVEFTVVAFQYPFDKSFYKWNDITVFSLKGRNLKRDKIFVWDGALTIAKYLAEKSKLDIVHSLWVGECALIGNRIATKYGVGHICTLMGQDVSKKNFYLRLLNKRKMKIVALSHNQKVLFKKLTNYEVDDEIFWGVPSQKYDYDCYRDIDLLGVGSLIPLKNFKLMIEIVSKLKNDFPQIKCKLIGSGKESEKLKKLCRQKNIENNFEFLGNHSRENVYKYMRRSRILLHPSLFEGSGIVFAEALANGMHIVSFNVGYAQENHKWKIANDEIDMIDKVRSLLSSNLDHRPLNVFPIERTVEAYAKLYGVSN